MKTCLRRPIKILQFLTRGWIQNVKNITLKYCRTFIKKPAASWVTHMTRDFLKLLLFVQRMQSTGSQGGTEIKKVDWGLFLILQGERGSISREGEELLLAIHKIQLSKYIWILCSLRIFLICLYASWHYTKYDINRYIHIYFFLIFNNELYIT